MSVPIGKAVRFTWVVNDPSTGLPFNPTGVVFTLTSPTGATSTPGVTNPSTGSYYADATLSTAGLWRPRWTATSPATAEDGPPVLVVAANSEAAWTPSLDAIAAHVPLRTVELNNLTGTLAGTFTGLTMPTAAQVDQYANEAAARVGAAVGAVDATLYDFAASVAAMWAAAQVELAQPAESFDSRRYTELVNSFNASLAVLVSRNTTVTDIDSDPMPDGSWSFGTPVPWGDVIL